MDPTLLPAGHRIPTTLYHSEVLPSLDFETYSEAGYTIDPHTGKVRGQGSQGKGGLGVVGTPVYAEHPSTEVLSLYYDLKDGRGRRLWLPIMPPPADLLEHVASGGQVEAWNVTFEFWIWNMVCVRRYGWPPLPLEQCHCAMAKARRYSLPGSLDNAAKVLGTPQKEKDGKRLLEKLTRPHTPTKNRTAHRWTPATAWEDFQKLYDYNGQDVVAEDHASARIPDLTPYEFATWRMDQTINARGVLVDVQTLDAALSILGQTEREYTVRLFELTNGAVGSVSEVAKFGEWLATIGVHLPNMQAETVRDALKRSDLPPAAREALEIRDSLGAANVKKLRTLRLQVSSDGRLRDQYRYCGADRTGRFAAGGVQLQNITAKGPKTVRCGACGKLSGMAVGVVGCPRCGQWVDLEPQNEWTIEAVLQAIEDIRTGSLEHVERMWGAAIAVLCGCLRGLFVAAPGKKFICVDFSAIEAVGAACLSRCQWRIDVFSTHGKIYEASAAKATGIPFEEILEYKKQNGMHHPARKGVGKIRELAGGYGGWIGAWKNFGADEFFDTEDDIKADVLKWREESPEIVEMWGGQYRWCGPGKWDYRPELFGLEGAAIAAIQNPGQCYSHHDITYGVADDILFCRLPSGRYLHYHRPRLVATEDRMKRGPAVKITYEGWNSNATKGPVGWQRLETFGGRLFENCIAEGTPVLTDRGWIAVENVGADDLVHDGLDWVAHGGLLYKNEQTCIEIDGVWMTPDHEVLTHDGWKKAEEDPRPLRPNLRGSHRTPTRNKRREKGILAVPMRMWGRMCEGGGGRDEGRSKGPNAELRVFDATSTVCGPGHARHEPTPGLRRVPIDAGPVLAAVASRVEELRGARDNGLRKMGAVLREFLGGHGADLRRGRSDRPEGQRRRVYAGELPMGPGKNKREQQTCESDSRYAVGANDGIAAGGSLRDRENHTSVPPLKRVAGGQTSGPAGRTEPRKVYDVMNAGPLHRFIVMGDGGPFIVHNCDQAVCADIQTEALLRCEQRGYPIVMHTHDEGVAEVPDDPRYTVEAMAAIMSERPTWASWWPIRAAGWEHQRYQKD